MNTTKKLSVAQKIFLARCSVAGEQGAHCWAAGGRRAGCVTAAWYRTADSLVVRGLVRLERIGDHKRAFLVKDAAE